MQGIRFESLTNEELAKVVDNEGTKNISPEVMEHVALRFIEIFRHDPPFYGRHVEDLQRAITPVPFVA